MTKTKENIKKQVGVLKEICGETPQIAILELLLAFRYCSFTVSEIHSRTGLGRTTIYRWIPKMIEDHLVIEKETKRYTIADNAVTKALEFIIAAYITMSEEKYNRIWAFMAKSPLQDDFTEYTAGSLSSEMVPAGGRKKRLSISYRRKSLNR